jgi:ribosomal protein S18 acetylase RimI-like enzyme
LHPAVDVGSLRHGELPEAQRLLARAFRDNPLNRAVIGSSARRRLRANLHGMRAHLPQAERYGLLLSARVEARLAGVLSSTPPGAYPLPAPSTAVRLRCLLGQGPRVAHRWAKVYELLRDHHPAETHWYLGTLGVEPELWGRGVGTDLLSAWLRMVDADAEPAYLETDAAGNIRFYRRAGFEVVEEIRVHGVTIWTMRRPGSGGG